MSKSFVIATIRRSSRILALGIAGLLAACGGGGGGDGDSSIQLSIEASQINPGESTLLFWDATFYDSCSLVGSPGLGAKAVPKTSGNEGFSTGVIEEPGTYTFTLSCTGALAGQGSGSVVLTVSGPAAAGRDCGVGLPTQALINTVGTPVTVVKDENVKPAKLCVGCTISNKDNIVNKDAGDELGETYASILSQIAIDAAASVTVKGTPTSGSYPAGPAGFLISTTDQLLLNGDARRTIAVQTLLGGVVKETYTTNQTSFLGLTTQPNPIISDDDPFAISIFGRTFNTVPSGTVLFVGFEATQAFDAIRLISDSKISGNELRVYAACVGAP